MQQFSRINKWVCALFNHHVGVGQGIFQFVSAMGVGPPVSLLLVTDLTDAHEYKLLRPQSAHQTEAIRAVPPESNRITDME